MALSLSHSFARSSSRRTGNHSEFPTTEERFAHWAELSQLVKALWRWHRGPLASVVLIALPTSRGLNFQHSAFGCVDAFAYTSLSSSATADVATDLTSLAIIEQFAPGWGVGEERLSV